MKIVVTGSSELIGSEVVRYVDALAWTTCGPGFSDGEETPDGSRCGSKPSAATSATMNSISAIALACFPSLRNFAQARSCMPRPNRVTTCLPPGPSTISMSTRLARSIFLMQCGAMRHPPSAIFVYMSTNKVYGDAPNGLPLVELSSCWEYAEAGDRGGIREDMRIDQSKHSLFGASKVAADVMVQEYGRYFGLSTCCLRGGCLTGPNHSGVEFHGFLSCLVKVNLTGGLYRIYGYKGK